MKPTDRSRLRTRRLLLPVLALVVGLLAQLPTLAGASASESRSHSSRAVEALKRVPICHRTNSRTNPYNQIVVARSAAINAHADHEGPIFGPDVKDWGDIIPPLRPELPSGRNWPEGRAILRNGCEMEPEVGPVPQAAAADVECAGTTPSEVLTLTNRAEATRPALFGILVNGTVVRVVGPVAPGASETVTLDAELAPLEGQTFTVEVRSREEVVASRLVTVACTPATPRIETDGRLTCGRGGAEGVVSVTNNGSVPVEVRARSGGRALGPGVEVAPGASRTATIDLSRFEDQTLAVEVRVGGALVGTYTATPDCLAPKPVPKVSVAPQVCRPPTSTVTLSNTGDPASQLVFAIRVDRRVVLRSAPLYGGDTTTMVVNLSRYQGRTVVVTLRANGSLLGRRSIQVVDCHRPTAGGGGTVPIGPS